MSPLRPVALAAALVCLAGSPAAQDNCVVCHGAQGLDLTESVHAGAGISCIDCHGGRAGTLDTAEAHGDDLVALTDPAASVESCGGCHSDLERMRPYGLRTDQLALYRQSPHGRLLATGHGADTATCTACHGAHAVFRHTDPRSTMHAERQIGTCARCHADAELMDRYELPADVPEAYRDSVHGRALLEEEHLASPSCTDCHGSHGATPPQVTEVGQVCGSCHTVVREYFEQSPHMEAVRAGHMEECVSCHGHHEVGPADPDMFLGEADGHCRSCHIDEEDPALQVAASLHGGLASLDEAIRSTDRNMEEAAEQGLFLEREHGYLEEAKALRARGRSLTHTLSPDALTDLRNRADGMIQQTAESLDLKHRGLRDRRIFTGLFLLVVLVFATVLRIYRRDLFGPGARPDRDAAATKGADRAA